MSKSLRNFLFEQALLDPTLTALGLKADNLWPIYSRDAPPITAEGGRFVVLRWGTAAPGIGRNVPLQLEVWAYDLDPDYTWITDVLKAFRALLTRLVGSRLDPSQNDWLNAENWEGSSADLFDDLYNRYTRSESWRLVASGN